MANYTTLIGSATTDGSIKQWVNRTDIPITVIFAETEAWLYQRLRIRELLTSTTGTATASATSIPVPSDYRAMKLFSWTGTDAAALRPREYSDIIRMRSWTNATALDSGTPYDYGVKDTTIEFPYQLTSAMTYQLDYYRALPALSTATATNVLTERFPRLLRNALLWQSYEWLKDEARANDHYQKMLIELQQANADWAKDQVAAGIVTTPLYY